MSDLRKLAEGADRVTFFQRGRKDGHPFVLPETILTLLDENERLAKALRVLWNERLESLRDDYGSSWEVQMSKAEEQARAALNTDD